jgi:putative ABC transport system substrate-binding protein
MTSRRKFLLTLSAGVMAAPRASIAQSAGKMVRVGFLGATSATAYASRVDALRSGLRDFGYLEGKNLSIEFRWAEEEFGRLPGLAAELVGLNVDVIVTHSVAPVRAAKEASATIPIVIAAGADPLAEGLVASLARPGGNITGSTNFVTELAMKRLALLKETFPRIRRVAALVNPTQSSVTIQAVEDAAKELKIELQLFRVSVPAEIEGAIAEAARKRFDAVAANETPMLIANAKLIAEAAARLRIPSMGFREIALAGGLMAYGVNTLELWRRAAYFVDRIVKGAKPGDIPIEQATKFELVLNAKTAKTLGVNFPQTVLVRADMVIE